MPGPQVILDGLRATANHWVWLAIMWHVAFGAVLAGVASGWRPDRRFTGGLCAIPLASVSVLAWTTGNPFNGTVFAVLAVGLVAQAMRLRGGRVELAMPWGVAAGGILAAFGWTYPHFLEGRAWTAYLYAAPLGLIPCPTLSALAGIALMFDGIGSRGWAMTLATAGAAYGLIGWLRLGVTIDVVLLAGAVGLGAAAMLRRKATAAPGYLTGRPNTSTST